MIVGRWAARCVWRTAKQHGVVGGKANGVVLQMIVVFGATAVDDDGVAKAVDGRPTVDKHAVDHSLAYIYRIGGNDNRRRTTGRQCYTYYYYRWYHDSLLLVTIVCCPSSVARCLLSVPKLTAHIEAWAVFVGELSVAVYSGVWILLSEGLYQCPKHVALL